MKKMPKNNKNNKAKQCITHKHHTSARDNVCDIYDKCYNNHDPKAFKQCVIRRDDKECENNAEHNDAFHNVGVDEIVGVVAIGIDIMENVFHYSARKMFI